MSKNERSKVIDVLNMARDMELHAIHQYMNQHYFLDDADYGKLAKVMKKIAIDEMKHAEDFAERIKDLDGDPCAAHTERVVPAKSVYDIYSLDAKAEEDTIAKYNEFIKVCRECNDQVTANIFEKIIDVEWEHYNYFDDVDRHIKELKESYLARMAGDASE